MSIVWMFSSSWIWAFQAYVNKNALVFRLITQNVNSGSDCGLIWEGLVTCESNPSVCPNFSSDLVISNFTYLNKVLTCVGGK